MSVPTMKDAPQLMRYAYDEHFRSIRTSLSAIPIVYDTTEITYVAAGSDGEGEIETVTYIKDTVVIATLTCSYNTDDKLESAVWTY